MDKDLIIDAFIKKFVLKDRRHRAEFELKNHKKRRLFIDRLNHVYADILDMKYFQRIDPKLENAALIQRELNIKDNDKCYAISHYDEFDDKIVDFRNVFDGIHGTGFGSLIINLSADRVYLETSFQHGPTSRYIGKRTELK